MIKYLSTIRFSYFRFRFRMFFIRLYCYDRLAPISAGMGCFFFPRFLAFQWLLNLRANAHAMQNMQCEVKVYNIRELN